MHYVAESLRDSELTRGDRETHRINLLMNADNTPSDRWVLVLGHRPAMADWLDRNGIPFAVWHDKPIRQKRKLTGCVRVVEETPFPYSLTELRDRLARQFDDLQGVTHAVAGTESGVVAAAVARQMIGSVRPGIRAAIRCRDKLAMKQFLSARRIPLIPWRLITGSDSAESLGALFGWPVVVKQPASSGGRGLQMARNAGELRSLMEPGLIAEQFTDAAEASVETIVQDSRILLESMTRYVVKRHVNLVPAALPPEVSRELLELNRRVIEVLGIDHGITHAEYYLGDGGISFGEIAWRPPGGYIMDLIELAYGVDAWDAFLRAELELPTPPIELNRKQWAASVLVHPGPGIVTSIEGEVLRDLPGCQRLVVNTRPGNVLAPRDGSGDVAAFAILHANERVQLENLIGQVRVQFVVQVDRRAVLSEP